MHQLGLTWFARNSIIFLQVVTAGFVVVFSDVQPKQSYLLSQKAAQKQFFVRTAGINGGRGEGGKGTLTMLDLRT